MARSPRGHLMRAAALRTLVQAPSIIKYRREPSAPVRCDFSNERLEYCVDIGLLALRCDRTGFMVAFLSGLHWTAIPSVYQGRVAADIRRFRRELKAGGYAID